MADCSCDRCVAACKTRPGWATPDEAQRFIDDGLADKLMLDWLEPDELVGNDERIYVIAPAGENCAGEYAPEGSFFSMFGGLDFGKCMFLTADNKCGVHDHKPTQCRLTMACDDVNYNTNGNPASNYDIARLWNTEAAHELVTKWRDLVGLTD